MIRFSDFTDIQSWRRSIAAETAFTDAAEDFLRTQSEVGGFCHICRRLWIGVQKEPRYGGDRRLKGTPISMV